MRHLILPAVLTSTILLAACGGKTDAPMQLTQGVPTRLDANEIDAVAAFLAGSDRYNTYKRTVNGKPREELSRILVQSPDDPELWDAYDTQANRIEFRFTPQDGVQLLRGHNGTYRGWIAFDRPLNYAPPKLARDEDFREELGFAVWTDKRSTSTGEMQMDLRYRGIEELQVLEQAEEVWRVDSTFKLSISLFIGNVSVWVDQRQWLHPELGEVRREIDGTYGFLGIGLKDFSAAQELASSRPVEEADRQRLLELYRNPPPPPKGRVDEE